MSTNYKAISGLKIFKNVIDLFISTFFVMYFLNLSNDNLIPLVCYYLIVYFTVWLTIFTLRNICKSPKRVYLLRIGIILNFIYFLLIYFLKENMIGYTWLIAIVYGLEEGFYFSVYNNFESTGIKDNERKNFLGMIYALKSILSIVIPLIFGSIMSVEGFDKCIIVVLVLVILQMICSFVFKDIAIPKKTRTNLKEFVKIVGENTKIRQLFKIEMLNGAIYSGAFNTVVTIYIIRTLKDSMSYGIFTSIFAIMTTIVGFYFAKLSKPKNYTINLIISGTLTIFGIILIIFKCNFVTIIIFNLFQSYSKTIAELINSNSIMNIANIKELKDKFKVEYFLGMETFLVVGRTIGYLLLLTLAFFNTSIWTNIILILFAFLIILFTKISINLQRISRENKTIDEKNVSN